MIGIVLITHGGIGEHFKATVENMLGPQADMAIVSVGVDTPVMEICAAQDAAVKEVSGDGEGVLVFSDIYGCTPCNVAKEAAVPGEVMVLSGLNVAMLLEAAHERRHNGLMHVAQAALRVGRDSIGFVEPLKKAAE